MRSDSKNAEAITYFDGFCIKLQAFLFIDKKLLDVFTLIALKLDHLSHFSIVDDGAIACYHPATMYQRRLRFRACATRDEVGLTKLLLDDLENLLLIEFLWKSLNRSQGLTAISFYLTSRLELPWKLTDDGVHSKHSGKTYAGCEYEYSFATALSPRYPRRLRRTGLPHMVVSELRENKEDSKMDRSS